MTFIKKRRLSAKIISAMIFFAPIANADVKIASRSLLGSDRTPEATLEVQVNSVGDGVKALLINDSADAKDLLVVEANGEVGIGTSVPAYLLDVNGTARVGSTPLITTAAKALVKNPASGQISEQLLPQGPMQHAMSVSNLSNAQVDSVITLGNLDFRYNSNANNDDLAIRSTTAKTVHYTFYEMWGTGSNNFRSLTTNLTAGVWKEQFAGGVGVNQSLRYTIFDVNGDFYKVDLRQ
ncbi:hypothetical protein OAS86_07010, partial [Gammaproteobacteria bacterium]|nr:hypothetical protein [Gammaproteobacteria bacterium]